eukprot:COSAG03_NODE_2663_length_2547_cov_1.670343_3_plen_47_part_01
MGATQLAVTLALSSSVLSRDVPAGSARVPAWTARPFDANGSVNSTMA